MDTSGTVVGVCKERGGEVIRTATRAPKTVATILNIVDNMNRVPNFLGKDAVANYIEFLRDESEIYLVDDVGVIFFAPREGYSAEAHITFWDGKLRGRESLCRKVGECYFNSHDISNGVFITVIPCERETVISFAKRVGFKEIVRDDKLVVLEYKQFTIPTVGIGV